MQKVAAYILERSEDLEWPDARKAEGDRFRKVIEDWLKSKGASSVDGAGTYDAVDGSHARYQVNSVVDGDRSWRMFELSEVTTEGRKFVTSVSVTVGHRNVVVFVTMEVGAAATSVTQIQADPKCPMVVRTLLDLPGGWYHGASRLRRRSQPVHGFEDGESLALEIQNKDRTIPFVVVSCVQDTTALPKLDEKLARELAGIANVYSVDEDASWALTDVLRKPFSTYEGAVRIYWPHLTDKDAPFRHQLWTAARLRSIDVDQQEACDRIGRQVREIVMQASAAGVVRPSEIDEIRGAAARSKYAALQQKATELEELKTKAKSLEEFKNIADSYAADNDNLRHEIKARDSELNSLREEVRRLQDEKQTLIFHLGQSKTYSEATEIEADAPGQDDADRAPAPGEVRFYKKTKRSNSAYDVFVRVGGCKHKKWQSSESADKARKGLVRMLGEHSDWKSLLHCGSCTGGGLWKVEW